MNLSRLIKILDLLKLNNFSSFKNQVKKRKAFYNKCNFKQFSIEVDLNTYSSNLDTLFKNKERTGIVI